MLFPQQQSLLLRTFHKVVGEDLSIARRKNKIKIATHRVTHRSSELVHTVHTPFTQYPAPGPEHERREHFRRKADGGSSTPGELRVDAIICAVETYAPKFEIPLFLTTNDI